MITGKIAPTHGKPVLSPRTVSRLRDTFQRHVDAEAVAAALKGEFPNVNDLNKQAEIRLRAAVATNNEWKDGGIEDLTALDEAVDDIIASETKHVAWKEVASNHAKKREFLASEYPKALMEAKTSKNYKELLPKEKPDSNPNSAAAADASSRIKSEEVLAENFVRDLAWSNVQVKIKKRFGSIAPHDWKHDAPRWVHETNKTKV